METKEKQTYQPSAEIANEAKRGLELRKEYGRGGTAVGVARARDLSNRKELPIETIARMFSYFSRHIHDREAEGWNKGEQGYPSRGKIADLLWGGRSGQKWATAIWQKYKKENNKNLSNFESLLNENSSDELVKSIINGTE